MKPIDQTKLHSDDDSVVGNCFVACIASILEFPLEHVPAFDTFPEFTNGDGGWWFVIDDWLRYYKLNMNLHTKPPAGYSIACGPSPRSDDIKHACIAKDGSIVHDPHPSRDGLVKINHYVTLEKIGK